MKKIINYRPLLALFLGLCIGTTCACAIFNINSANFVDYCVIIGVLILTTSLLLLMKGEKYLSYLKMGITLLLSIMLGVCLVFGVVGKKISDTERVFDEVGRNSVRTTVEARVCSTTLNGGKLSAVLGNIKLNGKSYGKMKIKISFGDSKVTVGDNLTFEAVIFSNEVIAETINTKMMFDNIYYYGYASGSEIVCTKNNANLIERVRIKTDNTLKESCDENYGILKALLLGDKSDMEQDTYENYKLSGLAHILSISGLHIGFIAMMIYFLLKKLKANTKVQFFVTAILLILYCALCGFISSVVRATIMSICLMLANVIGERNDHISSLSLAGIILLFINPIYVIDIGFQLSFLSVFGILVFARSITKFFVKIHLPNFIASSFAVTLSATILTLPVLIKTFGYISPISLIANLVILPLFSIFFSVLFIAFLINLIIPIGFMFSFLSTIFSCISAVTTVLAKAGVIKTDFSPVLSTFAYYTFLLLASRLNISNKLLKQCMCIICAVVCVAFSVDEIIRSNYNFHEYFSVIKTVENSCMIQARSGNNTLVYASNDNSYDFENLSSHFKNFSIRKVHTIIVPNYTPEQNEVIIKLIEKYKTNTLFLPTSEKENSSLLYSKLGKVVRIRYDDFYYLAIDKVYRLKGFKIDGKVRAYWVEYSDGPYYEEPLFDYELMQKVKEARVLVLCDKLTLNQTDKLIELLGYINYYDPIRYVLSNDYNESLKKLIAFDKIGITDVIIKNTKKLSVEQQVYIDSLDGVKLNNKYWLDFNYRRTKLI